MDNNQLNILLRFVHGAVTKETAIGFFVQIILDKQLFKSNKDVGEFASVVFDIHFLPYALRSRTLMCSRICKLIVEKDTKQLTKFGIITRQHLESVIMKDHVLNPSKNSNGALNNMELWVSGILKKD